MNLRILLGSYLKIGLAWSINEKEWWLGASGGAVTALLRYLLESGFVDAVLVPRIRVVRGYVYDVVKKPSELINYSGSIYAPTVLGDAIRRVLDEGLGVAVVATPCRIRALRRASESSPRFRECFKVLLGLYCNNVPATYALRYAVRALTDIDPDSVVDARFRGFGWPGVTRIRTRDGKTISIPFQRFWDSGFGQYFYEEHCFLCADQTAEYSDISFADPWTYQRGIGIGKTLVVVRTETGLRVFDEARRLGYIGFEELPSPLYAIQYTTALKKTIRVTKRRGVSVSGYILPPSLTSIAYEIDYRLGGLLSRREKLWPLLALYARIKHYLYKPFYTLDYLAKTSWVRILEMIRSAWMDK